MTDAHCHVSCGDPDIREFLIGRDFIGVHPWEAGDTVPDAPSRRGAGTAGPLASAAQRGAAGTVLIALHDRLLSNPKLGVGEIGLDRLKNRIVSQGMREVFESQLQLAAEYHRPVVLHGAKCWGQVVSVIRSLIPDPRSLIPSFLFHGFSRSDGLIPDIVALNGYISVGPAVLNDHAVNYRELVKKIPLDRLLIETDRTPENAADCPSVREVAAEVAKLRGMQFDELEFLTDRNASRFLIPDP